MDARRSLYQKTIQDRVKQLLERLAKDRKLEHFSLALHHEPATGDFSMLLVVRFRPGKRSFFRLVFEDYLFRVCVPTASSVIDETLTYLERKILSR